MRYFSEKILRLRFALVEEQLPPAIVLLESAALSTTLRMTHYFSWVFNLQIIIRRAGLFRFGAVMDRYAFLYSSFFILFHWEQGGKIIWMMLVAKKGKSQLL